MVANEVHHHARHVEHTSGGKRAPVNARRGGGPRHDHADRLSVGGGQRAPAAALPTEHEQEEQHADTGADHRNENLDKEARKAIAVDIRRLINLFLHAP